MRMVSEATETWINLFNYEYLIFRWLYLEIVVQKYKKLPFSMAEILEWRFRWVNYHFESLVFSWLSLRPTPEGETRHCHVRVEWSCSLSGVVGSRWYSGFYSQWRRDGKTNSYRSSAGACNCACLVCVRTGNNTTYLLKTLKKVHVS